MGPFSLLGLNRPSRQPASSFEGKCAAYLLQAPMVYPPQATPVPRWVEWAWGRCSPRPSLRGAQSSGMEGHPACSPLQPQTLQP